MSPRHFTRINLDTIRQQGEPDYIDGDLTLLDDIREIPFEGSLLTDMIIGVICTEGKAQVEFNGTPFTLNAGELLVCPPNVYLDNYMVSPSFRAKAIGLSYAGLQRMLHIKRDIWDLILYLTKHPVYPLPPEDFELLDNYYALLRCKLKQHDWHYHREVMQALFLAVFYDFCSIILPAINTPRHEDPQMKSADRLVQHFLKLVADSQGRERSVAHYADKLCISPKYLGTVCKAASGKTALEWIHESTMSVIIQQLKYSDRSVKEIADDLRFPNISFFGKFVKAHLGVSPLQYRKRFAMEGRKPES